jgi:cysteinyl-tRNA synthetase
MTDTRVGPCPSCGGFGKIPDGIYSYANSAIKFLTGPATSVESLKKLESFLRNAKKNNSTKEEIEKKLAETSPEIQNLFSGTPVENNFIQWLTFLIAIVGLAVQIHTSYYKKEINVEEKVIEYLLKENKELKDQKQVKAIPKIKSELHTKKPQQPYIREESKIQRNDLCPCGSGLKFKKCCWLTTA